MPPDVTVPLIAAGGGLFVAIAAAGCSIALVAAVFVGLFVFLRRSSKRSKALTEAAQNWPSTMGKVIKSRVEVLGGEYTSVTPHIIYEYEVNGFRYESDQIKPDGGWYGTGNNAYDMVDK